jgi:hypothetical protein
LFPSAPPRTQESGSSLFPAIPQTPLRPLPPSPGLLSVPRYTQWITRPAYSLNRHYRFLVNCTNLQQFSTEYQSRWRLRVHSSWHRSFRVYPQRLNPNASTTSRAGLGLNAGGPHLPLLPNGASRGARTHQERMVVRDFASVLQNKGGVAWREIGGCALANDRVDR